MNHKTIKAYNEMKSQLNPQSSTENNSLLKKAANKYSISTETQQTKQEFPAHLLTTTVLCDLLNNLLNLKNGMNAQDPNMNDSLEILEHDNLKTADQIINSNIVALRKSIDESLKYLITEEDYSVLDMLEKTAERDALIPIYERLYSYYIGKSSATYPEEADSNILNKCIKMLLESEVKGIYKKQHSTNI